MSVILNVNQFRKTTAFIHLSHLVSNVKLLRAALGEQTYFCAMVKANGYGHGDVQVARTLQNCGVNSLGVSLVEEGLLLRAAGIQTDILVYGAFESHDIKELLRAKLTPVVSHWDQLNELSKLKSPIDLHIKFDTGMHRLGFDYLQAAQVRSYLDQNSNLNLKGLLTHLHSGEDAYDFKGSSFEQLRLFKKVQESFADLNVISHALNSAGALNFAEHIKNKAILPDQLNSRIGVRPGLAIYGYSPIENSSIAEKLKPVLSLRSEIIKVTRLKKGDGVSYGHTWKAKQDSLIGLIPIGYADGYHRRLSNRAEVIFQGQRVPVIGNICMDFLMIDLTKALAGKNLEDFGSRTVTLLGLDDSGLCISAVELAEKAQTISWEILTSIGVRVPKVTIESGLENE